MMTANSTPIAVDQKLHSICRALLSLLGAGAGIGVILWLMDWAIYGLTQKTDATFFISIVIRALSFIGTLTLSFLATYGSQPQNVHTEHASPTIRQIKQRIWGGVLAGVFFADLCSSTFAVKSQGLLSIINASLLLVFVLGAVICVATGRAILKLWKEAEGATGTITGASWQERTEFQVNKQLPSVGPQTAFSVVFISAWLLNDSLAPLIHMGSIGPGITRTLEASLLVAVAIAHFAAREFALAAFEHQPTFRTLTNIRNLAGGALALQLSIRLYFSRSDLPNTSIGLCAAACALGLIAATVSLKNSHSNKKHPSP